MNKYLKHRLPRPRRGYLINFSLATFNRIVFSTSGGLTSHEFDDYEITLQTALAAMNGNESPQSYE